MSRERILQHLQTLGVLIPEEQFDDVLRRAEQSGWSHLELLDRLFGDQALQKRERIIQRRIRDAHFAGNKTLEGFDWKFNAAAIDRAEMEELATGDFIRRGDKLLMVGQSGIGKTHLLEGIGRRACLQGYRVRYIKSDALLADLGACLADGTTAKRLRYFTRPDLLIIDRFGFDRIEREQSPQGLSLFLLAVSWMHTILGGISQTNRFVRRKHFCACLPSSFSFLFAPIRGQLFRLSSAPKDLRSWKDITCPLAFCEIPKN